MKKTAILLNILLWACIPSCFSQLIADAGPDQYLCVTWGAEETFEGALNGSASGGVPPYTYAWETEITLGSGNFTITFTASDFLNDTTSSIPLITDTGLDTLGFRLTVTDAEGATSSDTTTIYLSSFASHLAYMNYSIEQGDSIFLNGWENISGGIPPYEYLWQPTHGLSDSTSLSFWAKPETSVAYYMTVTDSIGCVAVGAPVYYVEVLTLSANDLNSENAGVQVYPNPSMDFINLQINPMERGAFTFNLFSSDGRLVEQGLFTENAFRVDVSRHPAGVYIYEVLNQEGFAAQGRIVLQ